MWLLGALLSTSLSARAETCLRVRDENLSGGGVVTGDEALQRLAPVKPGSLAGQASVSFAGALESEEFFAGAFRAVGPSTDWRRSGGRVPVVAVRLTPGGRGGSLPSLFAQVLSDRGLPLEVRRGVAQLSLSEDFSARLRAGGFPSDAQALESARRRISYSPQESGSSELAQLGKMWESQSAEWSSGLTEPVVLQVWGTPHGEMDGWSLVLVEESKESTAASFRLWRLGGSSDTPARVEFVLTDDHRTVRTTVVHDSSFVRSPVDITLWAASFGCP